MKQDRQLQDTANKALVRKEVELIHAALGRLMDDMNTTEMNVLLFDISSWLKNHTVIEKVIIHSNGRVELIKREGYCPDCGAQLNKAALEAGYKFCPHCGGKLKRRESE